MIRWFASALIVTGAICLWGALAAVQRPEGAIGSLQLPDVIRMTGQGPLDRLTRDEEPAWRREARMGETFTVHATLTASDHELKTDPASFTLQNVTLPGRGATAAPATLLLKPGDDFFKFCARARGRRVVVTVWMVPR